MHMTPESSYVEREGANWVQGVGRPFRTACPWGPGAELVAKRGCRKCQKSEAQESARLTLNPR